MLFRSLHVGIFGVAVVACCVSLKTIRLAKPLRKTIRLMRGKDSEPKDIRKANYVQNKHALRKAHR